MVPRTPGPVLLTLLLSIFAVAGAHPLLARDGYKPLHRLGNNDIPCFADDMDIDSLIAAASHQAALLKKQDPWQPTSFGTETYHGRRLLASVSLLLAKLQERPSPQQLNRFMRDNYLVYQAGGRASRQDRRMLVTGYYEPVFAGSLTRQAPYLSPLYSPPKALVVLPAGDGTARIGRYDRDRRLVPFWSRAEIENGNLLAEDELVYLQNPFDAFLLHVQGSGKILLPDKSIRSVRFAGSNGLAYNSIGKLLVDEKLLALAEVNIPAIRAYLQEHPNQQQRILHHNPRFIFFQWGDHLGPRGSTGESLTAGRSIALDSSALPGGTIGYLVSRRPIPGPDGTVRGWQNFSRFVFPQDSGAAVKGPGRVDIFWGQGDYAELAANHMKEEGELYLLVKKESQTIAETQAAKPCPPTTR